MGDQSPFPLHSAPEVGQEKNCEGSGWTFHTPQPFQGTLSSCACGHPILIPAAEPEWKEEFLTNTRVTVIAWQLTNQLYSYHMKNK